MPTGDVLAPLLDFGFTELEAEIYVFLVQAAPATGYRVAQAIGKPVANTYKAIESLQNKGAIIVDEGANRICRAVPAEELLDRLERRFQQNRRRAAKALSRLDKSEDDDRIYQLESREQIFERCRHMLARCEQIAVLDLFPAPLEELRETLEAAADRGIKVAIKAYAQATMVGVEISVHSQGGAILKRWPGQWLNLVTDGREYLLAYFGSDGHVLQSVWSGSPYLSWVYHSAVSAELVLSAIQRHLENGATAAELREVIHHFRYFSGSKVPGYVSLLRRFEESERSTNRPAP